MLRFPQMPPVPKRHSQPPALSALDTDSVQFFLLFDPYRFLGDGRESLAVPVELTVTGFENVERAKLSELLSLSDELGSQFEAQFRLGWSFFPDELRERLSWFGELQNTENLLLAETLYRDTLDGKDVDAARQEYKDRADTTFRVITDKETQLRTLLDILQRVPKQLIAVYKNGDTSLIFANDLISIEFDSGVESWEQFKLRLVKQLDERENKRRRITGGFTQGFEQKILIRRNIRVGTRDLRLSDVQEELNRVLLRFRVDELNTSIASRYSNGFARFIYGASVDNPLSNIEFVSIGDDERVGIRFHLSSDDVPRMDDSTSVYIFVQRRGWETPVFLVDVPTDSYEDDSNSFLITNPADVEDIVQRMRLHLSVTPDITSRFWITGIGKEVPNPEYETQRAKLDGARVRLESLKNKLFEGGWAMGLDGIPYKTQGPSATPWIATGLQDVYRARVENAEVERVYLEYVVANTRPTIEVPLHEFRHGSDTTLLVLSYRVFALGPIRRGAQGSLSVVHIFNGREQNVIPVSIDNYDEQSGLLFENKWLVWPDDIGSGFSAAQQGVYSVELRHRGMVMYTVSARLDVRKLCSRTNTWFDPNANFDGGVQWKDKIMTDDMYTGPPMPGSTCAELARRLGGSDRRITLVSLYGEIAQSSTELSAYDMLMVVKRTVDKWKEPHKDPRDAAFFESIKDRVQRQIRAYQKFKRDFYTFEDMLKEHYERIQAHNVSRHGISDATPYFGDTPKSRVMSVRQIRNHPVMRAIAPNTKLDEFKRWLFIDHEGYLLDKREFKQADCFGVRVVSELGTGDQPAYRFVDRHANYVWVGRHSTQSRIIDRYRVNFDTREFSRGSWRQRELTGYDFEPVHNYIVGQLSTSGEIDKMAVREALVLYAVMQDNVRPREPELVYPLPTEYPSYRELLEIFAREILEYQQTYHGYFYGSP